MRIKAPKNFLNRSRESPLWGDSLPKKWKFLIFWGPHSHPSAPIDVKFCTVKRTHVSVGLGPAKFDLNRCNGEKPDFWPVSKNNTGSLPLRGNPAGNNKTMKQYNKPRKSHALFCLGFLETIPSPPTIRLLQRSLF